MSTTTNANFDQLFRTFAEMDNEKDFIQYLERLRSGLADGMHDSNSSTVGTHTGINRPLARLAHNTDVLADRILFADSVVCVSNGISIYYDHSAGKIKQSSGSTINYRYQNIAAKGIANYLATNGKEVQITIGVAGVAISNSKRYLWFELPSANTGATSTVTLTNGSAAEFNTALGVAASRMKIIPVAYLNESNNHIVWMLGGREILSDMHHFDPGKGNNLHYMTRQASRIEKNIVIHANTGLTIDWDANTNALTLPNMSFRAYNGSSTSTLNGANYTLTAGQALFYNITDNTAAVVAMNAAVSIRDEDTIVLLAYRDVNDIILWTGQRLLDDEKVEVCTATASKVRLPITGNEEHTLNIKAEQDTFGASYLVNTSATLKLDVQNADRTLRLGGNLRLTQDNTGADGDSLTILTGLPNGTDNTITIRGVNGVIDQDVSTTGSPTFNSVNAPTIKTTSIQHTNATVCAAIEADGDAHFNHNVGIGTTPSKDFHVVGPGGAVSNSASTAGTIAVLENDGWCALNIIGANSGNAKSAIYFTTDGFNPNGSVANYGFVGYDHTTNKLQLTASGTGAALTIKSDNTLDQIQIKDANSSPQLIIEDSSQGGATFSIKRHNGTATVLESSGDPIKIIPGVTASQRVLQLGASHIKLVNAGGGSGVGTEISNGNNFSCLNLPGNAWGHVQLGGYNGIVHNSTATSTESLLTVPGRMQVIDALGIAPPFSVASGTGFATGNSLSNGWSTTNGDWRENTAGTHSIQISQGFNTWGFYFGWGDGSTQSNGRTAQYSNIPAGEDVRVKFYVAKDPSNPPTAALKLQKKAASAGSWTDVLIMHSNTQDTGGQASQDGGPKTTKANDVSYDATNHRRNIWVQAASNSEPWHLRWFHDTTGAGNVAPDFEPWYLGTPTIQSANHNSDLSVIQIESPHTGMVSSQRDLLSIYNSLGGWIGAIQHNAGGTISYLPFTGAHIADVEEGSNVSPGQLVKVSSLDETKPEISYNVVATTTPKDKAVIGVYSPGGGESSSSVMSVGNGRIIVCNEGGNIEIGDYICSSSVEGAGMKQDDDLMHNYTVAKSTENVDWSQEFVWERFNVQADGGGFELRKKLDSEGNPILATTKTITCTYHCG